MSISCYLPKSNMFLILTARNCGRARRKLLTSTSTNPEIRRLLLLLPFCMNKGRSFIALNELKKQKYKNILDFNSTLQICSKPNFRNCVQRKDIWFLFYPFFSADAPALALNIVANTCFFFFVIAC